MLRRASPFPLFLALALAASPALAAEDISRVNGGIEVDAGQQAGDLSTVNGGIRIGDGASFKDATTVNGGIRAGSRIRGAELTTVNGGIQLGEQARADEPEPCEVNVGAAEQRDERFVAHMVLLAPDVVVVGCKAMQFRQPDECFAHRVASLGCGRLHRPHDRPRGHAAVRQSRIVDLRTGVERIGERRVARAELVLVRWA